LSWAKWVTSHESQLTEMAKTTLVSWTYPPPYFRVSIYMNSRFKKQIKFKILDTYDKFKNTRWFLQPTASWLRKASETLNCDWMLKCYSYGLKNNRPRFRWKITRNTKCKSITWMFMTITHIRIMNTCCRKFKYMDNKDHLKMNE